MRKRLHHISLLVLLLLSGVLVGQTQHITPFTGSWKLNVPKSQFQPGPPPQSVSLTFAPDGTTTLDIVNQQGKAQHISYPWSDGKEVPVTGEGLENTTATDSIHGRTKDNTMKTNGKVGRTSRDVLAPDGRSFTATVETTDAQGRSVRHVEVYDKQ